MSSPGSSITTRITGRINGIAAALTITGTHEIARVTDIGESLAHASARRMWTWRIMGRGGRRAPLIQVRS